MDPDGPTTVVVSHRLRPWIRRGLWLLLTGPPLGFALSNLWLASGWGRAAIASRIERRCGLETRIGGASWSPWNGVTLRQVELLQPAALRPRCATPLLSVERLRIEPVWSALAARRLSIRALTVERPQLAITVELLAHLAQQATPPETVPAVAAGPVAGPPVAVVGGESAGPPQPAPPDPGTAVPPPVPTPPSPPSEPTRWVHVRGAEFRLYAAGGGRELVAATGMDGDFPLAGANATGKLGLASLTAGGERVLSGFAARLTWQAPVLALEPETALCRVAGLDVRFIAHLAFNPGLPVQVLVEVPRQRLSLPVAALGLTVDADTVMLQGRFIGALLAPGSWQGDVAASAGGIALRHPEHRFAFDRGSGVAALRGGMLSCADARLIGDDLSLLGNGTLLADGRVAAVMRVVGPPETAAAAVRRWWPDRTEPPPLGQLSTPQRVAFDVSLSGTLREPVLRVGGEEPAASSQPPPAPP